MKPPEPKDAAPTMYCWHCSYVLDWLSERRCPECGRSFDPDDPRTFRRTPKVKKRASLVLLMYLLPLALFLIWWAAADSTKWDGYGYGTPLKGRLALGIYQACGPFAWVILKTRHGSLALILLVFSVTWGTWLILVWQTRLRSLPYVVHLLFSTLWCVSGCPPPALFIT
jgi:hypothetical protein